ncbi:hypothetical protein [Desulfosporosinus meridiei]|uniref:Uncharacterized protein n=1 Tax=Desulfosporosinus meridiei (strain ATCC BAA-275 / DSM 13257 / KCTC 12902 / NCIMB 13706 / S10) TaxID=768704 RepID=J7J0I7_DESMD|nr:hypothetical protein [Desulfosporosinus meridiei]AFQ44476.1 hypothetical protein Desmer_2560 [Desulfosporosinus meridiei DSM 13257]
MSHNYLGALPDRIVGIQRLEALLKENGYLICQFSGEKIYDLTEVVAIFLPLGSTSDQIVAVRSNYAPEFVQKCLSSLQ